MWRLASCLAVAGVFLSACAAGEEAPLSSTSVVNTSTTTAFTSTTAAVTTTSTAPNTTTTLATTTSVLPANYLLRVEGIGPVDFGTPAEAALAELQPLLGPADRVLEWEPDCYLAIEQVQAHEWDAVGLRLVFTDWGGTYEKPVATPLHLSDWETFAPGLATTDGLGWGSTVADLEEVYPEVLYWINDFAPTWLVETPQGRLMGGFDWSYEEFSIALQTALNEHGANLEVTGDWMDGVTEGALFDFIEERGLEEEDMLSALDLPTDDVKVGSMFTGSGPSCD